MGIFHDMTQVINLAPVTLTVTFDGQSLDIPPGEAILPRVTVLYAKNQNPVPGTQDMDNPNISGAQYMISVKGKKGDRQEPFTQEEWAEICTRSSRFNMDDFYADQLGPKERVVVRGKGRRTQAKGAFDAGVRVNSPETFVQSE